MKRATPKGMAQVLLEHDDLSDVDQPQEKSSSHAAEDELQHREGWWWLVLVVTREDHPLGIDDDTVGSSITAPVSTSAHVVLLDQGLSQQAAPKDGTLTRTPRARGRQASLWNRRLGPLCGEGRVARKSRRAPVYLHARSSAAHTRPGELEPGLGTSRTVNDPRITWLRHRVLLQVSGRHPSPAAPEA